MVALGGEFGAGWRWPSCLALLGAFPRVSEPLFEKVYRPGSITAKWKRSAWRRLGVLIACMCKTRRARLSPGGELAVQRALVLYALKRQWWRVFHAIRRSLGWPAERF